jgi:hypothetical protein
MGLAVVLQFNTAGFGEDLILYIYIYIYYFKGLFAVYLILC